MASRGTCIVIVCLLAVLLLTGCGNQEGSGSSSAPAQTEKRVTLTLWHAMGSEPSRRIIQAAVDRFQNTNPLTTVVVEVFDEAAFAEKLASAPAGGGPDVFFTRGGAPLLAKVKAGKVLNVSKELAKANWKNQFLAAALDLCGDDAGTWAVPVEVSFVPVWYNTEIAKDHRFNVPDSFSRLVIACQDLSGEGMIPMALGNKDRVPGTYLLAYLAAREGGVQSGSLDEAALTRAAERIQRIVRAQAFPGNYKEIDESEALDRFIKFQTAMCLAGVDIVPRIAKESEKLMSKLDCFAFPSADEGTGDPATVLGGVDAAFAVSASCKNPDRATMLLRYLASPETAADLAAQGRIPALTMDEAMLKELPAPTQKAMAILTAAKKIQPYYHRYLPKALAEETLAVTHELLGLSIEPVPAAARLKK